MAVISCAELLLESGSILRRSSRKVGDGKRPFEGIGKPEPLRESLSGFWSRCIDEMNHLVYVVDDDYLTIISCRYHN